MYHNNKQIPNYMKTISALLVATLGMHTDSYLLMVSCAVVVIYLIIKD